ncbi:hypothetical protein L4L50_29335 [Klebsiella pneumoniae]|nr:hypothetical protein [Klebsiella pneumoniae]
MKQTKKSDYADK